MTTSELHSELETELTTGRLASSRGFF